MMDENAVRRQVVEYARRAYDRRLVGGTGGNFSARLAGGRMLVTASGVSLGDTTPENLLVANIENYTWEPVEGCIPSKEYRYHADILRLRPDVNAVLHVHPPHATAYAVRCRSIPMVTDAAFKQPPMPHVPFAPSGSDELQQNVVQAIEANPQCKVLLLEEHGIVALGKDVLTAYNVADLTEELAWIAFLAEQLGHSGGPGRT
jgi:ribulose-5-phosphate 4-epimerase/fuculose-1-phosphate aldolase